MVELIIFVIGFALGWWIQSWISARAMMDILDDIDPTGEKCVEALKRQGVEVEGFEAALAENSAKPAIQLKVESVNGMLMAYRAEDDFYVAQGQDAETLFESILDKHPEGKIEVVEGGDLVRDYVETLNKG
jgi:hypothetical protein